MIAKKSLIAILFVTTSSFAYFNEEDYSSETSGWNNFNNTPVVQNRYNYYKQGVSDTLEILNDEQSNFFLDGKRVTGIENKYLVVKEINKNNLADYIFMRSVASKVSSQYPIAVLDGNRGLLIFGYFDDKNSASLLASKLQTYSINAEVIKPNTRNYIYRSPLKEVALDEKLLKSIQNSLTKVVVVEKTKYINGNPVLVQNKKTNSTQKSTKQTKKVTKKSEIQNVKNKSSEAIAEQKVATITNTELDAETKIKCLEWLKKDLIQNGLYNLETKQIKYMGQIYGVGDDINFACSANLSSDFKITQIVRMDKSMSITFNNLANKKLDVKIKYPQNGFVSIDELFFDPEQPYRNTIEKLTFVADDKTNQDKVIQMPTQKISDTQLVSSVSQHLYDFGSSVPNEQNQTKQQLVEEKPVQQSQNNTRPVKAVTMGSEQATCSFKLKDGIRTQIVKQVNGEYKIEAIPPFYQNKILPVEYFSSGNFMAITAIGAQSILINKEHFNKYCH